MLYYCGERRRAYDHNIGGAYVLYTTSSLAERKAAGQPKTYRKTRGKFNVSVAETAPVTFIKP